MDKFADGSNGGGSNPSSDGALAPVRKNPRVPWQSSPQPLKRGDSPALRVAMVSQYSGVTAARRQLLADFCRFIGKQLHSLKKGHDRNMAPRLRQTLSMLLEGDAEKEIARKLGISRHTVHVYIKSLHKHFDVSSRSELMALFIKRFAGSSQATG